MKSFDCRHLEPLPGFVRSEVGIRGPVPGILRKTDCGAAPAVHNRRRGSVVRKKILIAAAAVMLLGNFGCAHTSSTADLPAVQNFELEKYLGTWYEIARMPHRFERDLVDVKAEYTLRPDGKVKVVNSGRQNGKLKNIEGVARMKDTGRSGELQVSFFRPFYGDYRIVYLTPDYTVAIVTSDTRDYLWILARTPVIAREQLQDCLERAEKFGFATRLLQYPNGNLETVNAR